jgi:hypothetical protein
MDSSVFIGSCIRASIEQDLSGTLTVCAGGRYEGGVSVVVQ